MALFKKPKTFEEGIKVRDKIIEAFEGEDTCFIIAFRVGNDLVSTLCGSKEELEAMVGLFARKVDEL